MPVISSNSNSDCQYDYHPDTAVKNMTAVTCIPDVHTDNDAGIVFGVIFGVLMIGGILMMMFYDCKCSRKSNKQELPI